MNIFKIFLLAFFCCQTLLGEEFMIKDTMLVFMTPIQEGKADVLKENVFSNDEESLFSELGISKYHRWIQKIHEDYFLVHQVEGQNPQKSFAALHDMISSNDSRAIALQELYRDTLGIDIQLENWIPEVEELIEPLSIDIENSKDASPKEYCFIYPIIPSKKDKLLELYQDKAVYNCQQIQNIYQYRGISKTQLWIQGSYLIIYQEIIGPVTEARDKYLNSKEDALSRYLAEVYSEITGLSFEKLLPALESLDDAEVLK